MHDQPGKERSHNLNLRRARHIHNKFPNALNDIIPQTPHHLHRRRNKNIRNTIPAHTIPHLGSHKRLRARAILDDIVADGLEAVEVAQAGEVVAVIAELD